MYVHFRVRAGANTQMIRFSEAVSRVSLNSSTSPKKQDPILERLIKQMGSQTTTIAITVSNKYIHFLY